MSAVASREHQGYGFHHLVCEADVDLVIFLALALTRNRTYLIYLDALWWHLPRDGMNRAPA